MFFELSKIFWAIAQPANFLFLLLGLATILLWWRPNTGRVMITTLVVMGWLAAILPIGEYYLRKIENTYSVPQLPAQVDGVILLGGFTWLEATAARGQLQTDQKVERFLTFAALAQKYPNAKLIFTGGSGNPAQQSLREADVIRQLWINLGYDPNRVIWERDSRNTYENAVESKRLVNPKPGEKWVLVTSALHMPRAVAIFEKQSWPVIPYPVDYTTMNGPYFQYDFAVTDNLWRLSAAMREIIGKWVYEATGRS